MKIRQWLGKKILGSAWDDMIASFLRGDDVPVVDGQIPINMNTAMRYSAVFACIRVLSETLASLPIPLYRKKPDGDRESMNDLGIYDILHNRPNEEMSPFSFKEMCMVALNTGGNAVAEKQYSKYGDLVGLYPYKWTMTSIDRDKNTGKLQYKIRGDTQERILSREQVFHVPGLSFDGVIGLSPIEYATSAIRLGLSYETFGNSFYKNGMNPSIALEYPNELSEEAFKRLKADLDKAYAGLANVGKALIAEGGAKVKELTIKPADAQLIESKHFQIEDIARYYRVPLHLIQDLLRATNNNIEHQSLEFVIYSMMPWVKRWEEAINMQLLTRKERMAGYYFEFKMDALLRGDMKSRSESYAVGRQWGWLSVNDIRRLENQNSIGPAGDIYLEPLNMHEAGKPIDPSKTTGSTKAMAEEIYKMIEGRR